MVGYIQDLVNCSLTIRGLSLYFKILPISNTGDSIAYNVATVHFLYPKLGSFSDMEYYFHQLACWDSKVPKRFIRSNQMQCSPSFDCGTGANKMTPLHVAPATPTISGFTARKMPQVPTRARGRGRKMQNSSAAWGLCPLRSPALTGGHPPLKFPPSLLFRPKGGQKTINFFSHVHQLVPDAHHNHLDSFV